MNWTWNTDVLVDLSLFEATRGDWISPKDGLYYVKMSQSKNEVNSADCFGYGSPYS